jgi:hypothetical protein
MRRPGVLLGVTLVLTAALAGSAWAGFDLGIIIGDGGLKSFHLAVGDYYGKPEREVAALKKGRVHDEELPVVFFLSARARVSSSTIVKLRLKGMSWMDISLRYGLSADVYHVDVRSGPPYGKAYGHFKKPKKQWKKLRLSDADVVNLVNLRFLSEHYGFSATEIMRMRDRGESFVLINENVRKQKKSKGNKQEKKKGKGKKR